MTTLEDVGWWVQQQLYKKDLIKKDRVGGIIVPGVLYSAQSELTSSPDAREPNWWANRNDYILRRGDFLSYDLGINYLEYFATIYKRVAYITRKGETGVPESIQHAFDRALGARSIIRKQLKVGKTAGQTFQDIISAMEDAGYIHTPFIDIRAEDVKIAQKALANTDRSGFSP